MHAIGQRESVATTGSVFTQSSGAWGRRHDILANLLPASTGSTTLFRHRVSTKPVDADTGLCYCGVRYFDPLAGRWLHRDPIGEVGRVNLYGFEYDAKEAARKS